ncbi:cell division protein SepF [Haloimpatiens sp. FM7315]|uniref:cell division protein SepF n=1 Tax=Haloimpatiens sp. FM7315 TaxID=3298609 RepID=UPI0035A268DC
MAGKVLNKFMGLFGLEDDYEEIDEKMDDENENEDEDEELECSDFSDKNKQGKVVNIHTASSVKVIIVKPETFDEAADICDNLKNRKIVVINTVALENRIAQRLLDFIGGASYSLGGSLQEIEKSVYLVSPSNVAVTNDLKNELSSKGIFSFSK